MTAFFLLGDVFIGGLYQRGEFLSTDTPVVYAVLAAYAVGLLASSGSRVLSSSFYAMRDTRTPARMAYLRVVVSLAVGISLMFWFDRFASGELHYGATGLALGASVAAWLEYGLLRRRLARVLGPHGPARSVTGKILGATAVAAFAAVAAKWILGSTVPLHEAVIAGLLGDSMPWLVQPALAASTAFVFGLVYLTVTTRLGIGAPLRQLMGRPPKHS